MSWRRLVSAFLVIAGTAGLWVFLRRDAYIVSAVETYGSAILGVKVRLSSAHLSVAGQSLELRGLVVGNPEGYKSRALLELDAARVSLDVTSLARDVVLVREVTLLKPEITYEKVGGVSNVDVVQRNADNYVRGLMGAPAAPPKKGTEKRFIIDDVVVRDARALVLSDLVLTKSLTVAVPNVHLRDIGKKTHGATSADATRQVLSALTASVTNAVGSAIAGAVRDVGDGIGKGVKGAIRGIFGK